MATVAAETPARPVARERDVAFFGLLQLYSVVTRALERELSQRHGISLAGYEVLNRLAAADEQTLRVTDLAERTPLSTSRVSRIVDELAARGMVGRRACSHDRRVSYVGLLSAGADLLEDAQATFHEVVEERFLGRLSRAETEVLSEVFERLTGGGVDREAVLAPAATSP